MASKKEEKKQPVPEKQESLEQDTGVGNRVLRALGQPQNLQRIQVRRLWGDHFRVNVFIGADFASARVAHSYFLVADGAGNITACNPEITKQY